VDDFDGLFQRLNVSPGKHEIALKLAGYKTHRVRVWVAPESTLKLKYEMEKGSGETFEDQAGDAPDRDVRPAPTGDDARRATPVAPGNMLRLTVQPADASVYVDGEFRGSGTDVLALPLVPGRHKIEVVRPGFRTQEREVEIGAQSSTELTIALERP